jgi:hypothetical protein
MKLCSASGLLADRKTAIIPDWKYIPALNPVGLLRSQVPVIHAARAFPAAAH